MVKKYWSMNQDYYCIAQTWLQIGLPAHGFPQLFWKHPDWAPHLMISANITGSLHKEFLLWQWMRPGFSLQLGYMSGRELFRWNCFRRFDSFLHYYSFPLRTACCLYMFHSSAFILNETTARKTLSFYLVVGHLVLSWVQYSLSH